MNPKFTLPVVRHQESLSTTNHTPPSNAYFKSKYITKEEHSAMDFETERDHEDFILFQLIWKSSFQKKTKTQ